MRFCGPGFAVSGERAIPHGAGRLRATIAGKKIGSCEPYMGGGYGRGDGLADHCRVNWLARGNVGEVWELGCCIDHIDPHFWLPLVMGAILIVLVYFVTKG